MAETAEDFDQPLRFEVNFKEPRNIAVLFSQRYDGITLDSAIEKLSDEQLVAFERYLLTCDQQPDLATTVVSERRTARIASEAKLKELNDHMATSEFQVAREDAVLRAQILGKSKTLPHIPGSFEAALKLLIRIMEHYATSLDGGKRYADLRKKKDPAWIDRPDDDFRQCMNEDNQEELVKGLDKLSLVGTGWGRHTRPVIELTGLTFVDVD